MADNIDVTPGTGATVAADDVGGALHQRVKLSLGANGTAVDAGAGAGAVGTDTQRVTLGSDDPAVVALQLIDNAISGSEMQVDVVAALPAGTNNIGDVDVLSLPSIPAGTNNIGDVDVLTLPALAAGTNLIGRTSASHETSTVYSGTTALTPKFKKIDCSSSGNNEIVAAVTGKKIRVLAWDVSPSDVVNFKWRTASTDITGLYYAANAGNGVARAFNPVGYFETVSDEALNLNLSAAEAVGGSLVYVEV